MSISFLGKEEQDPLAAVRAKFAYRNSSRRLQTAACADEYPLSFSQEQLWLHDRLVPPGAYNCSWVFRLRGALHYEALDQAFVEIVRRHGALRTAFPLVAERPVQVICPAPHTIVKHGDLSQLPEPVLEAESLAAQEQRRPIDLWRGPILRVCCFKLAADDHLLTIVQHHITTDGVSAAVLKGELQTVYGAFRQGDPSPMPDLQFQLVDYAVWQRNRLSAEQLDRNTEYWSRQLANLPRLELPVDHSPRSTADSSGVKDWFSVPKDVVDRLRALSNAEGATLFISTLAAFQVLLFRWTSQHDVPIVVPIADRTERGTQDLIGFLVNMLLLRGNLSGNPSFREFLKRTRDTVLQAFAHQDVSLETLLERLQRDRGAYQSLSSSVTFAYQNASRRSLQLEDLDVTAISQSEGASKFDLSLSLRDQETDMRGTWEFNSELFDAQTIHSLTQRFLTLLTAIAENPDQRVLDLPVLTADERHRLLVEWNSTATEYPREACIHELFARQAEQTPDAVALVQGDQHWTYRQLNRAANSLAHRLRRLGYGPEVRVGLLLPRSANLVIAMLATVKAGGAYVPLDQQLPQKRMETLLRDAGIEVVIVDEHGSPLVAADGLQVLAISSASPTDVREWEGNAACCSSADNMVYLLYTSGSTGVPKGVAVTHRNVIRLAKNRRNFEVNPDDAVLLHSNPGFDATTFEVWATLLNGARLVVFPGDPFDLAELSRALIEHQVSTLWLTAGLFHQVVEQTIAGLADLRQLIAGGDVLSAHHVRKVFQETRVKKLINGYGPTENTTFSCCYTMTCSDDFGTTVPIGNPIANSTAYILNGFAQPAPLGTIGELVVGGDGLARGYHGDPRLTAERFIPQPFTSLPGERLYRTGDQCRYRSDGVIEFLGRQDNQVKIRGFRIELGEIESALREHELVRDVAVTVRGSSSEDKQLVACLVCDGGPPSPRELRAFLQSLLPGHMVPAFYLFVDALPITANGKVDRAALAALPLSEPAPQTDTDPEMTPVQEMLMGIWCDLLSVEHVGIDDDFLDLGGHSLLATKVVSRIRDVFHIELPLRALFADTTIRALSKTVETLSADAQAEVLPEIQRVSRDEPIPLSSAQMRLWTLDRHSAAGSTYNVSLTHRLRGPLHFHALVAALAEITRRHETIRTRIKVMDGMPVQSISPGGQVPLRVVDLAGLNLSWSAALQTCRQEADRPFDLIEDLPLRPWLFRMAADDHVLHLTFHHIAVDGWSCEHLLHELEALYHSFCQGAPAGLGELSIQYADFTVWQQRVLGTAAERQVCYWQEQLDSLPPSLQLPTLQPSLVRKSNRGAAESLLLTKDVDSIARVGRKLGATMFMTLLAVFKVVLHRYSGQTDIVVGIPIAGRRHGAVDRVIGFFVNTLPLRSELGGQRRFDQFLTHVRDKALAAYQHQDVPYERLAAMANGPHDELFRVTFSYQGNRLDLQLPGLDAERLRLGTATCKFDLSLEIEQTADGLRAILRYSRDLFSPALISQLLGHYHKLLLQFAAEPTLPITDVSLLDDHERRQLLEWSQPDEAGGSAGFVHAAIEQQAIDRPDAMALTCGGEHLTYGQLNERANQLAHYLRSVGAGPHRLVAVCLESSIELVVVCQAAMKIGAGFVPLDPTHPRRRLSELVTEAGINLLVTRQVHAEHLSGLGTLVFVDSDKPVIDRQPRRHRNSPVTESNLLYVIFTSGSTGRPKGVAITHGNFGPLLQWSGRCFGLNPQTHVLQNLNPCFDFGVFEVLSTLAFGGRMHILPRDRQGNFTEYADALCTAGINTLHCTPSFLRALLPYCERLDALRTLRLGGEALSNHLVAEIYQRIPSECRVFHSYGPTETTVTCSIFVLGNRSEWARQNSPVVPIGRPTCEHRLYVLDRNSQLVPVGLQGELHVAGPGLSSGYLGRPRITAEKFVPNPFHTTPGSRLYKTGDLVRYREDGNLEFLGRLDHQVKIRGHRVELEEIEVVLRRHPDIQDALVVLDSSDTPSFSAYIIPAANRRPSMAEVHDFLNSELPRYMVPAAFTLLDAFPLTRNGKIDRSSLPAAERYESDSGAKPRSPMEECLTEMWCEMLAISNLGIDDNFFALGGNSILATQLILRVSDRFEIELPMYVIFEHATVATLAAYIESALGTNEQGLSEQTAGEHDAALHTVTDVGAESGSSMTNAEPGSCLPLPMVAEQQPASPRHCPSLRRLIVGGEDLSANLATWAAAKLGTALEIFNEYGPTEATVGCSVERFAEPAESGSVPIGDAIDNLQLYVLNDELEEVSEGELYIGGIGLARGYLNQPGLTSDRFRPNPFDRRGGLMYKSGDLVRRQPNGTLVFIGRRDEQVKINGYRIEPGEIESVAATHPDVRQCVVIAQRQRETFDVLTLFIVGRKNEHELARFLSQRLPHYMLPKKFVYVDSLPVTASGKINRRLLSESHVD